MLDDEVVIRLLDQGAVRSVDGRRLGRVGQLFRSDSDGESTWVSIADDAGSPLQTLVPMVGSTVDGDDLQVAYRADAIAGAPQVAVGAAVSGDDEQRVRTFYALDNASALGRTTGSSDIPTDVVPDIPTDVVSDIPTDVVPVVRSEERLSVATQWVPVRRARLEKFQLTETRTIEVPWTREEVRVVYDELPGAEGTVGGVDPAGPAGAAPAVATPRPWVLMEERIVVTKEWVPAQSVRLVVDRVAGEQQVTASVRKEQVSLDLVEPAEQTADVGSPAVD